MYAFFVKHGFIFELFFSFALFAFPLKKRRLYGLRILLSLGVLFLYSVVRSLVPDINAWTESLKYVVLYLLCIGAVLFIFDVSLRGAVFCAIGASLTQHCAFKAGELTRYFSDGRFPLTVQSVFYVLAVAAVNALSYLLFARRLGKDEDSEYLQSGPILLLSGAMLLLCVLFQQLFEQYATEIGRPLYIIFGCFDMTSCAFALCIQYAVYRSGRLHRDYRLLEHILHLQKEQMEVSKETIDLINIKCHDLKKQIAVLGDKNHITKEEIGELNRAISIYDAAVKTGNEALDVLLAEKTLFCEKKNIQFNCIADGYSLGFMRASDVYSLFGNAIDNAVEAVSKIEDSGRRCIGMSIKESKGMISAHFENYYAGELDFDAGLPVTTKSDKRYHGFGMKSIKLLAEKYGGWVSVNASDGVFNLNILLPIPKEKGGETKKETTI